VSKLSPIILACMAAALLASAAAVSGRASGTRRGGLIAFSGPGPGYDIVVVSTDGNAVRRVTKTPGIVEDDPGWSPDGGSLVFESYRSAPNGDEGRHFLTVVRLADGRRQRLVAVPGDGYATPAWSPDGRWIAFADTADSGGIYLVDRHGRHLHKIPGTTPDDVSPAWSPDGKTIAFGDSSARIETMRVDGSDRQLVTATQTLTGTPIKSYDPAWSPDGAKIAFCRQDGGDNCVLWILSVGTDAQRELLQGALHDGISDDLAEPTWSPTGRRIAFTRTSSHGAGVELWVVGSDRTDPHVLRRGLATGDDPRPAWQP